MEGLEVLKIKIKEAPITSGVYLFKNKKDQPIYIGKAINIKRRLGNYGQVNKLPRRLQQMVFQTNSIEFELTETERNALLLEALLIKKFAPRYNIRLKDDKSFPLIKISSDEYPTITDNGIGMNRDDLVNNLGTIARSGTAQFIKEATETKDLSLIGQFGVGFYSAFMVASDLTVITRKAGEKKLWIWKSDGESNFTIDESDDLEQLNSNRGTKIILSITKEGKEYLEKIRIEEIIRKYSDHISIPIFVRDIKDKEDEKPEAINSALALWTRPKNKITKEQYKEFYNHVGQMFDDPWLTSHYKAEGQIE